MTIYTKPAVLPAWAEDKVGVPADLLQPSDADIKLGWPLSSTPPSRQRFNWLLNYAANAIRYMLQRGLPAYDAAEDYPLHARVQDVNGNEYRCIQAGVNKTPAASPAWWRLVSDKITRVGVAAGTVDVVTVDFTPDLGALGDGDQILVQHSGANTVAFTINADATGAKGVYKGSNLPVVAGDIPGADFWGRYVYDTSLDKWQMLNPATGVYPASIAYKDLASFTATIAANALTVTLGAEVLDFRSPTLTTGVPNTRTATAAAVVVPNGATLGAVSGQTARFVSGWIDVGGVLEPFIVNIAGGVNLDETTLITTTALSAASNSAGVIYSTVARAGVPFRVRGFIDNTQAVAGAYATIPALVQPVGGQALAAMSSLGYGQKWQDVIGSRTFGTTYYNTTGKPIAVSAIVAVGATGGSLGVVVNGVNVLTGYAISSAAGGLFAVIPPNASYVYTATGATGTSFISVSEFR